MTYFMYRVIFFSSEGCELTRFFITCFEVSGFAEAINEASDRYEADGYDPLHVGKVVCDTWEGDEQGELDV